MRIAVLSDIHSNLVALDAVLAHAGNVDGIWHLGDVVGYGPDPDGVVARLGERAAVGVRGNHDAAALGGDEIDFFNPDAKAAMLWTRRHCSPATTAWLEALPLRRVEDEVTLVHGSPRDPIWEYVTSERVARANLAVLTTRDGLHGHTHVPIAWVGAGDKVHGEAPGDRDTITFETRRAFLNPGSVGQPRDGDPRSSYLVLDMAARSATWHRVAYDIDAVARSMRAAGLPIRLAERLYHGR